MKSRKSLSTAIFFATLVLVIQGTPCLAAVTGQCEGASGITVLNQDVLDTASKDHQKMTFTGLNLNKVKRVSTNRGNASIVFKSKNKLVVDVPLKKAEVGTWIKLAIPNLSCASTSMKLGKSSRASYGTKSALRVRLNINLNTLQVDRSSELKSIRSKRDFFLGLQGGGTIGVLKADAALDSILKRKLWNDSLGSKVEKYFGSAKCFEMCQTKIVESLDNELVMLEAEEELGKLRTQISFGEVTWSPVDSALAQELLGMIDQSKANQMNFPALHLDDALF
jgi:hypothetical protein